MSQAKTESFASVWDAIADTAHEAANLRVRSELMSKLAAIVEQGGWTQAEAARRCGITQPRINDLLRGRLSRFSLDALVNIAAALGRRVHVELAAATGSERRKTEVASGMQARQRRGSYREPKAGSRVIVRGRAADKKRAGASRTVPRLIRPG
jgi:predicted XRE-type DNA-binding protein